MENEKDKNLGKELNVFRLLRIARGKKAKELADELLISSSYIYNIEIGNAFPRKRLLRDYARVLGVTEEYILNFQPDTTYERTLFKILGDIINN